MFFKKEPPKPDKASAMRTLFESVTAASSEALDAGVDLRAVASALEDVAQGLRVTDSVRRPIL
jgi:hypothetical protein